MIPSSMRSHTCGDLSLDNTGEEVILCGWVHKYRDLGQLVFIDLRDRHGITQLVFDPEKNLEAHKLSQDLRNEWVIRCKGRVKPRNEGMNNKNLSTGEIEVEINHLEVLSESKTPPFELSQKEQHSNEELRLSYRYLDMRTPQISKKLVMRHKVCASIRNYLTSEKFLEMHTPYLAKSTPEGARDYLVPSRIHPGKYYALPQSPQIFKQLLMVGGMDRYYQICPCFRDEDSRSDRQPEFYQLDLEMAFGEPENIFSLIETLFKKMLKECLDISFEPPFQRLSYKECMERYGSDKPDLRYGMPLIRLDDLLLSSSFEMAKTCINEGGCSKALCLKGGASLSRKQVDALTKVIEPFGLKGLAWMKLSHDGASGPLSKFILDQQLETLKDRMEASEGDLILLAFESESRVNKSLDALRRHLAKEHDLIDPSKYAFLWVYDFPLFSYDEDEGRLVSEHHPFTHPKSEDLPLLETDPLSVRANCYDLVLNGYELGSGSQRIHESSMQQKVFEMMKLSKKDIEERFGFFVKALEYGAPPHIGIALGIERIVMILTGTDNIRDVMAFPKTINASDLMMDAPSEVDHDQLDELHIQTK